MRCLWLVYMLLYLLMSRYPFKSTTLWPTPCSTKTTDAWPHPSGFSSVLINKPTYHQQDIQGNPGPIGGADVKGHQAFQCLYEAVRWPAAQPRWVGPSPAWGGMEGDCVQEERQTLCTDWSIWSLHLSRSLLATSEWKRSQKQALSPFAVRRGCVSTRLFGSARDGRVNSEQLVSSEQTVAL